MDAKSFDSGYCFNCIIYFEAFSRFGPVFINCKHFFSCLILSKGKKSFFFTKTTIARAFLKQLLTDQFEIFYSYLYCALNSTLKFNFVPLFYFIKAFKKYQKHSLQNSLKNFVFSFSYFHGSSRKLK